MEPVLSLLLCCYRGYKFSKTYNLLDSETVYVFYSNIVMSLINQIFDSAHMNVLLSVALSSRSYAR